MNDWKHISESLPKVNEYVLVHAKYCQPPYAIARFTGDVWVDHDRKSEMQHIEWWQHLPEYPICDDAYSAQVLTF